MSELEKLFTVEEIAQMTSLTSRTIRNYLKDGSLKGRKIGGQWRFTMDDIKNFMDNSNVVTAIADETIQSVYDFLDGVNTDVKGDIQICSIIDLYIDEDVLKEKSLKIQELISSFPNETNEYSRYYCKTSTDNNTGETQARIIVFGSPDFIGKVAEILK